MRTEWVRSAPATPVPGTGSGDLVVGTVEGLEGVTGAPARTRPGVAVSHIKAMLVAGDTIATAVGMVAAAQVYYFSVGRPLGSQVWLALATLPLWPVLYAHQGLYLARRVGRRMEELRRLVNAALAGILVLAAASVLVKVPISRGWLLLAFPCITLAVTSEREVARRVISDLRTRGILFRKVILVGCNDEARELATALRDHPELGYEVVGFVSDAPDDPTAESTVDLRPGAALGPHLGTTQEVLSLIRSTGATGAIVATTGTGQVETNRLIRDLTREGLFVELTSAMRDISSARISVRPLGRYPVICVEPVATWSWRAAAKRGFDLVLASLALVAVSPVLLVSMLLIRLTTGPQVLFRQERVGRHGASFTLYKLRTMVRDAERHLPALRDRNEAPGPMFKITDDPRVTPIGRWLRRLSIDEIPQLVNVLKGDMSLVGPRPALPSEAAQWDDALRERLRVRPGITGAWQVNGRYTSSLETYARLDLSYVDNWSLVTDLAILAKTIPVVLRRRGAA